MRRKPCRISLLSVFILLVSFLSEEPALAQDTKIHFGIAAPVGFKLPVLGKNGKYSSWGNAGLCLVTVIEGAEENDLSLQLKTGFTLDFSRYSMPVYGGFVMDRASLLFNPELLFSSRSPRFRITAGFGVEWNCYFLAQPDADDGTWTADKQELVDRSRRKAIPFLSGGVQYELIHDIWLQLFLRQAMMNAFRDEDAVFVWGAGSGAPKLDLRQQPMLLGLCFFYFF